MNGAAEADDCRFTETEAETGFIADEAYMGGGFTRRIILLTGMTWGVSPNAAELRRRMPEYWSEDYCMS